MVAEARNARHEQARKTSVQNVKEKDIKHQNALSLEPHDKARRTVAESVQNVKEKGIQHQNALSKEPHEKARSDFRCAVIAEHPVALH